MNVLIVDDSAVVRRMVRVLFESDPALEICGEAENGREAIERAAESRPDLIIMDLSMPVMNGLDATRGIRRTMPNVPILLFSGYSDVFNDQEARAAGISAVVSKSDPSLLYRVAQELLRQNAA
jgi:DNA-binding NarL/FixJ family response regulator